MSKTSTAVSALFLLGLCLWWLGDYDLLSFLWTLSDGSRTEGERLIQKELKEESCQMPGFLLLFFYNIPNYISDLNDPYMRIYIMNQSLIKLLYLFKESIQDFSA